MRPTQSGTAQRRAVPQAGSPPRSFSIATKGRGLPGRYVLYGPEKSGKTSFAAYAPSPIFVQVKGETGLETLIDAGQLPETPHFPGEIESWRDLLGAVEWLKTADHDRRTLVIDGIDSAQMLCFDEVTRTSFEGDERKFLAYHKGYEIAPNTWKELLVALDGLRAERKMSVILIGHSRVIKRKNPDGEDWTCYGLNMHEKVWEPTANWADAILFYNTETFVSDAGKAKSGKVRILYTQPDATYVAGNRYGLPAEIEAGESGREAWGNFIQAKTAAAKNGKDQ